MITLIINDLEYELQNEAHLNQLIFEALQNEFNEFWIYGHDESKLNILTNSERAFMMYLQSDEDSGFSSRTTTIEPVETCDFLLANGQKDSFPMDWTVDKSFVYISLLEYYLTGNKLKEINWYID